MAAEVFLRWSKTIARAARREGHSQRSVDDLGTVLVSLYEGALLVARTEKSSRPVRSAAAGRGPIGRMAVIRGLPPALAIDRTSASRLLWGTQWSKASLSAVVRTDQVDAPGAVTTPV
jgi:hypothetical protein